MSNNPAVWFEIYVDDMARARDFYQAVLQVTLTPMDMPELEMMAFPSNEAAPGAAGALVRMEGFAAGANSTIVYLGCDDCAVEVSRVEAAGGQVFKPKFSIGEYGHVALITDTEGNMIGLHSMA